MECLQADRIVALLERLLADESSAAARHACSALQETAMRVDEVAEGGRRVVEKVVEVAATSSYWLLVADALHCLSNLNFRVLKMRERGGQEEPHVKVGFFALASCSVKLCSGFWFCLVANIWWRRGKEIKSLFCCFLSLACLKIIG